jgi:hypothetical protein
MPPNQENGKGEKPSRTRPGSDYEQGTFELIEFNGRWYTSHELSELRRRQAEEEREERGR